MSYTPGPWSYRGQYGLYRVAAGQTTVAAITYAREADARLIAAAPDLLQTLGVVVQLLREEGFHVTATKAEAVIAKARGEVP